MTRLEELRNDLENLQFNCRYYIGVLAELEQLGMTHTRDFKRVEKNLRVLQHNIRRITAVIEALEDGYYDSRYIYHEDGSFTSRTTGEVVGFY